MSQNNSEVHENDKTLETKSHWKSFFTFTIENFIDLNVSEIKSSKFSIGDTKWYVKVYPRLTQDLLTNNQLKLRFEIEFFNYNLYHENRITYDLHKLVNNNKYSDFVFIVQNKEFFAHKNILSIRSKVFKVMFSNDLIDSQSNRCTIDDMESEVFEELLTFICTGNAPKAQTMVEKLLTTAEKYEILEIREFVGKLY
jgi:hypothetical protein